jgi:non-specific serine/threonine protein kinase
LAQWGGDQARARALHEATAALWREVGDERGVAGAQELVGVDLWLAGEDAPAAALIEESLALARERGDAVFASRCLRDLGLIARARQEYDHAAALFEQSVEHARAAGHADFVTSGRGCLGRVAYLQGDADRAAPLLAEYLAATLRSGAFSHGVANALEWLAAVVGVLARPAPAARLFGAAAALRRATGAARYAPERTAYERDVAAVRGQLDGAAFEAAWAEGEATPLDEVVASAPGILAPAEAPPAARPAAVNPGGEATGRGSPAA